MTAPTPSSGGQRLPDHVCAALSDAVAVVVACLATRRGEIPERTTRDLVEAVKPQAPALAQLAVLLVERTPGATETLQRIALEAAGEPRGPNR